MYSPRPAPPSRDAPRPHRPATLLLPSGTPRLFVAPLASPARPSSGPMVIDSGDRLDGRLGPTEDARWVLPSRR